MHSVNSLLDLVKKNAGISSDYKLAQFLKMTQNTIANYRHGRSRPDDSTLAKLADLAHIPLEEIDLLAVQLQAERCSNDEARKLWERIATRLQGGFSHAAPLVLVAFVSLSVAPREASATTFPIVDDPASVRYVKSHTARRTRRLFHRLASRFAGMLRNLLGAVHVQSADTDAAYLLPA